MILITENVEEINVIVEETQGKKHLYIEGIFLQAEIKNRNGRVYPYDILSKEVQRYNEHYVKTGRALGELGHPDGPSVNLERVCHRIIELRSEGSNFYGKAKILDTPTGQIAKSLLEEGVKLGVSSRGMGSLEERNGTNYVRSDFMLATAADIVADPSAPDAFVNGIMEGKEWIWQNGILKEQQIDTYSRYISKSTRKNIEERKLKAFQHFFSNL